MMDYKGLYVIYLLVASCFILAMKGLSSPKKAAQGNRLGIFGMALIILSCLLILPTRNDFGILTALVLSAIIGIKAAYHIKLTALPQMVALLNGVGGLASLLVGVAQIMKSAPDILSIACSVTIGAIAFSGSVVAFFKLQGTHRFGHFYLSNFFTALLGIVLIFCFIKFLAEGSVFALYLLILSALAFGVAITLPVGGADMPVIISVLNACSGFAAVGIGFYLVNILLIITGTLVGISGTILAVVMTRAMNKSLLKVLFYQQPENKATVTEEKTTNQASIEDVSFLMQNAKKVIIVPGYGMASAGAQYALKNMAELLKNKYGVAVKFAIHPVAGRMPGHMNVLLAQANVDYDMVFGIDEINPDFETADVAYVIGANDITNPSAKKDPTSPLFGMPVLEVEKAKTVIFVKRSLAKGYSGVENPLFYEKNTLMLYGDAKKVTEEITTLL